MNRKIWQQLLSLESRDVVQNWFLKIHKRSLNTTRAQEINAAAKQAREFFRNANQSDYSVRSLLSFYGVACLSRAISLLFLKHGGEETLTQGHGLRTIDWSHQLLGNDSNHLSEIMNLKIEISSGLFFDFLKATNNEITIHINSSGVDWSFSYNMPSLGCQITLGEVLSRLSDLKKNLDHIPIDYNFANISGFEFHTSSGFKAVLIKPEKHLVNAYSDLGYELIPEGDNYSISCKREIFDISAPQFIHSYLYKSFNAIPVLNIATPFKGVEGYSQICLSYVLAYFLGMLTRYYPKQWISLIQGDKGDAIWPAINQAQQLIESSFPELTIELIDKVIKNNNNKQEKK
jgi:YaaC-like Protein